MLRLMLAGWSILRYFFPWLFAAFSLALPELIKRAMSILGVGLVTTVGITLVEGQLVSAFQAQLTGLPIMVLSFIGMMNVDKAFSLIVSAMIMKRVLSGITGNSQTKYKVGGNGRDPWSGSNNQGPAILGA